MRKAACALAILFLPALTAGGQADDGEFHRTPPPKVLPAPIEPPPPAPGPKETTTAADPKMDDVQRLYEVILCKDLDTD